MALTRPDPSTPESKAVQEAIIETFEDVSSAIERLVCDRNGLAKATAVIDGSTDLSIMVCDRSGPIPHLRLVFWTKAAVHPKSFQEFRLVIGNGNAGRAYKTRTLRLFDREQADSDPKSKAYVQLPGVEHRVMLSIPLLDPVSQAPLAVLNIGTTDATQAAMFRSLNNTDIGELVVAARKVLPGLTGVAGLRLPRPPPADASYT